MLLELEWRPPWEAGWDHAKKLAAAQKLADYVTQGTLHESKIRMLATKAEVIDAESPYLKLTLER